MCKTRVYDCYYWPTEHTATVVCNIIIFCFITNIFLSIFLLAADGSTNHSNNGKINGEPATYTGVHELELSIMLLSPCRIIILTRIRHTSSAYIINRYVLYSSAVKSRTKCQILLGTSETNVFSEQTVRERWSCRCKIK